MKQVIFGQAPSKSNSYRIIRKNGYGSLAKTTVIKAYENSFILQCTKYKNKGISGLFELHINFFNRTKAIDLDNQLKVVLDCLQSCKAVKNDRNCVKIVAQKFVDKTNPRAEFKIIEV